MANNLASVGDVVAAALETTVVKVTPLNPRRAVSFRVLTETASYKVFYCHGHANAERLLALLSLLSERGVTPRPVAIENDLLIAPWVEGELLEGLPKEEAERLLLHLLTVLHATPLPASTEEPVGFPYLQRLEQRLSVLGGGLLAGAARKISKALLHAPDEERQLSVLHTDVTVKNVVLDSLQQPVSIDNEAVTIGYGRAFDVWHCAESLYGLKRPLEMESFVRRYDQQLPGSTALSARNFWLGVCWAKKALKAHEAHRLLKARAAMNRSLACFSLS